MNSLMQAPPPAMGEDLLLELSRQEGILKGSAHDPLGKALALKQIQDKKLYRPLFKNFGDYQKTRLKLSASQVFYLSGSLRVYENLSKSVDSILPIRFSHCRPLIALCKSEQIKIWQSVQKKSDDEKVTLRLIKEMVSRSKKSRTGFSRRLKKGFLLTKRAGIQDVFSSLDLAFNRQDSDLYQSGLNELRRLLGNV
jgi:ribosomal protein L17